jgi:crossover junction endodeoxyribonuclease RuvC
MMKSRIIGFDPSLVSFGWGIIDAHGMKIKHVAHGVIKPVSKNDLHIRLRELFVAITEIIKNYSPEGSSS